MYPTNTVLWQVLLKVAALNDFYSTNIFSVYAVAQHIHGIKGLDDMIKKGEAKAVEQIADVKSLDKCFYSFATKYCSHHNPDAYPIYDRNVEKVLCYYRDNGWSANFKNADLKVKKVKEGDDSKKVNVPYAGFKELIDQFIEAYGLNRYGYKQIDQYLWQLGKEILSK